MMETYRNIRLCDIPSGMGGTLPAAVAADHGDELQVICLHDEFYPNYLLTVKASEVKPFSWKLKPAMKKMIDERKPK